MYLTGHGVVDARQLHHGLFGWFDELYGGLLLAGEHVGEFRAKLFTECDFVGGGSGCDFVLFVCLLNYSFKLLLELKLV